MNPIKTIAVSTFSLLLLISLYLVYQRTGLLPIVGAALGGLGLALTAFLQGKKLAYSLIGIVLAVVMAWTGSIYFVFSTWESGEVVEIQFDDNIVVRTWVVEEGGQEVVIYDCPPEWTSQVAGSTSVTVQRGSEQYLADLRVVDAGMGSDELNKVYALYEEKYTSQSRATEIYYLMIGPRRGSQLYALYLTRTGT